MSVVVPCFNLGRFIEEAIDSVLDQSYRDFEIVVVDDGSTEEETQRRLAALDRPSTRVVRSGNRGLSAARNLGIRHSTGEYICALDADDCLAPTWLEQGVKLLDAEPDVAFVSHWLEAFGDETWEWKPVRCDLGMLLDVNTVNGAALVRREVVTAVGGFDESIREGCEDWEFWIRVTERGFRGVIIPEVLYRYRRRPDSMSREMNRTDLHLRLFAMLVGRHLGSYRHHLLDLVLRREWTISELHRRIDGLETELTTLLEPALIERRAEIEWARARLLETERQLAGEREVGEMRRRAAWLEREREELHAHARRLEKEVSALRRSASWRVTAPLRWVAARIGRRGAR